MVDGEDPTSLEELLDRLGEAARDLERVPLGTLLEAAGRRSFGPMLLLAGLIALSPLSGIPGMPTTVAVIVALTAGQLLCRRDHFWLPQWLLKRSISQKKFEKALRFLRPPARFVDRFVRPRWGILTQNGGLYAIAILCILIAATMPPLELFPFAASTAGAALTTFGLALVSHDGLLALIALLFTVATAALVTYSLA